MPSLPLRLLPPVIFGVIVYPLCSLHAGRGVVFLCATPCPGSTVRELTTQSLGELTRSISTLTLPCMSGNMYELWKTPEGANEKLIVRFSPGSSDSKVSTLIRFSLMAVPAPAAATGRSIA